MASDLLRNYALKEKAHPCVYRNGLKLDWRLRYLIVFSRYVLVLVVLFAGGFVLSYRWYALGFSFCVSLFLGCFFLSFRR